MVALINDEHLVQGTEVWREWRKDKIGASDAPCIMEVGFRTPLQLWEEKKGIRERPENYAMFLGSKMEKKAREKFINELGIEVVPCVHVHPEYDWMIASLDGLSLDGQVAVEIKYSGKEDHQKALNGEVPEKYYPQLQHQMAVCGLSEIYYYSYSETSTKVIVVPRNDKYIEKLIVRERDFYDCMRFFVAPKETEADYSEKNDSDWVRLSLEYQANKLKLEYCEQQDKILKEQLVMMSQNKNAKGAGIKLTKVVRKGNVDYGAIPELKSVNLDTYRKDPIISWRISTSQA